MIACLYLIVNFSNGRNSKFSHKRKKKKKKKKKKKNMHFLLTPKNYF